MMRRNFIYSFFICLFAIFSCTTTRKSKVDANGPFILNDITEASEMLNLIKATDEPFIWFGAQGSGTIDWDGQRYSARMNVRIERNKVIWVQIQKFGFELARMYITPDSAFFINRLERTYSIYSTSAFLKKYNLPADFNMFSKVFTGGAYIPTVISKSFIESDHSLYIESGSGVNVRLWLDVSSFLIRSIVTDTFDHEWAAGFSDYRPTNTGQQFPFRRTNTLIIAGSSNLFDMNYSSIVINVPQEFPFSIPSHYEKI